MKLSKYAMSTNEKFKMPHKTYQTHEEKSYNIEVNQSTQTGIDDNFEI